MPAEKFTISLAPDLVTTLDERGSVRSATIARDLSRYYGLLASERAALRQRLSPAEVGLICDVCNGTRWDAQTLPYLPAIVAETLLAAPVAAKWAVDADHLLTTLRTLNPGQLFALVDAVERFWEGPYHKENVDWAEVLR